MEAVGVIFAVGHARNDAVAFFVHAQKAPGKTLGRCCQKAEVQTHLFAAAVAEIAHMADNFQALLLHFLAFAMVMAIKRGQGFGQADEANGKASVLEHLAHFIIGA